MGETYWIAGASKWDDPGGLEAWLAKAGLKTAWIDEIFWLSDSGESFIPPLLCRISRWPMTGTPSHRLLQLIVGELLLGRNDLVVMVEEWRESLSVAVLGTPRAVGRYNLLPDYRLYALDNYPVILATADIQKNLQKRLTEIDLQLSSIGVWATSGEINLDSIFDSRGSKKIELMPGYDVIDALLSVINVTKNQALKTGILIDTCASLMEVV